MRFLLFFVVLSALGVLAGGAPAGVQSAASDWTRVYSRPSPDFSDIAMFDDSNGLALASAGILRTTDGGVSWQEPQAIDAMTSGALGVADAQHAWAVGTSGGIWHTVDRGASWQAQDSGTTVHLASIGVVSATEAWATGRGAGFSDLPSAADNFSVLLHTTDGGATWTHTDGLAGFNTFGSISFVGTSGWLVAANCVPSPSEIGCLSAPRSLLGTMNAGSTWKVLAREPDFVQSHMRWLDSSHGVATGTSGFGAEAQTVVYSTSDGGRTWVPAGAPLGGFASGLRIQSASKIWISRYFCPASGQCHTWLSHTSDGGRTWASAVVPFGAIGLSANLDVTTASVLLAGGPTGIARYDIASDAWSSSLTAAATAFSNVVFAGRDRGYAVGSAGQVAVTDDGGATWTSRPAPASLGAIVEAKGDHVTVSAYDCALVDKVGIYRSEDGGVTWSKEPCADIATLPQPMPSSKVFSDKNHGWMFAAINADHSEVWRTVDAGTTWEPDLVLPPSTHAFSLQLVDGRLWVHAAVGVFGYGDRTEIWRRDVGDNDVLAPDTGFGPATASFPGAIAALAVLGSLLGAAGLLRRSLSASP